MGAIHGKGRFKCDSCDACFSWRLDLKEHVETCKHHSSRNAPTEQKSEIYVLNLCFLCGKSLVGIESEEAFWIKGNQKLFHSQRILIEVLEMITADTTLAFRTNHTIALCKRCMGCVNKWDDTHKQLQELTSSIRVTYRARHSKKKIMSSKLVDHFKEDVKLPDKLSQGEDEEEKQSLVIEDGISHPPNEELRSRISPNKEKDNKRLGKEYNCECGKVAHNLDELVDHQLRNGCKVKTNKYSCTYCKAVFVERKLLVAHKKACDEKSMINGAHECDLCGRRFLVRGRVETHKRTAHGIGTKDKQLCSFCGRTFSSCYNMKYHLAREHGVGRKTLPVTCNLCGKTFSEKSGLRSHLRNSHQDHRFECEHCGKKYATRGMRNHHINEMHNACSSYKCNLCGEHFKYIFRYRYHMRKMHSSIHHACKDCGRTFIMSSDLYRHVRGVHLGIRDRRRYPCKICGRMFPSMYKVKRHATSHGLVDSKDRKNSIDLEIKDKQNHNAAVIVPNCNFMATSLVKSITSPLSAQETPSAVAPNDGDAIIASCLTESSLENTDGTSIDVHQIPAAEIYSTPHITTLTPEILQGNMNTSIVQTETMTVDSVSSIVVSASTVQECMDAERNQPSRVNLSQLRRGRTIIPPGLQSSLVPMHQMIVFEESIEDPSNPSFSVRASNQVISVSQCTDQVLGDSQLPRQVICIPRSNSDTPSASNVSPTRFSLPLTQEEMPTIQYDHPLCD